MTADQYSREYRLRKQAELQMLWGSLTHLREREESYIDVGAALPLQMVNQIRETRRDMKAVEEELLALRDQSLNATAHQLYWQAAEAEEKSQVTEAVRLYKEAAREGYFDANRALRSLRHRLKTTRKEGAISGGAWLTAMIGQSGNHFWISLLVLIGASLIVMLIFQQSLSSQVRATPLVASTPTVTIIVVLGPTFMPIPTLVQTLPPLPTPTETPQPIVAPAQPTDTPEPEPTLTPTPSPTRILVVKPAPKIIGPRNELVWQGGAIIFEFEDMGLADDELYCLNTLRGYDRTNTENWSFRAAGSKSPSIPVEANVFEVAESQGMRCIVWSAAIGKDSCETVISQKTPDRVIGLPEPCEFN